MGSKNSILKNICGIFPSADNFYDLFGGGFSVTHFMLENRSKDFKEFHFNEIRSGICELAKDSIDGKYNYKVFKPEFIDRDRFFKDKDNNAYIKTCWSFGNNGSAYLFSKEIESYKKSMHNAIVFNQFDDLAKNVFNFDSFCEKTSVKERRLYLRSKIESYRLNGIPLFLHKFLNEKQLQQLERLEQLQRLHFYNGDYRDVKIKDNSIIYCDPPYIGTADYGGSFNHKDFYGWADSQCNPVFISEYKLDDNRFRCVFEIEKRSKLSPNKDNLLIKKEKLFVNKAGFNALLKARKRKKVADK